MEENEIRKYLYEIMDKLDKEQLMKLYHLVRGIFGKTD